MLDPVDLGAHRMTLLAHVDSASDAPRAGDRHRSGGLQRPARRRAPNDAQTATSRASMPAHTRRSERLAASEGGRGLLPDPVCCAAALELACHRESVTRAPTREANRLTNDRGGQRPRAIAGWGLSTAVKGRSAGRPAGEHVCSLVVGRNPRCRRAASDHRQLSGQCRYQDRSRPTSSASSAARGRTDR